MIVVRIPANPPTGYLPASWDAYRRALKLVLRPLTEEGAHVAFAPGDQTAPLAIDPTCQASDRDRAAVESALRTLTECDRWSVLVDADDLTVSEVADHLRKCAPMDVERIVYTTAPASYDWQATTLETFDADPYGTGHTATYRKVAIHHMADAQCDRYASGCHGATTEDPRVTQAETEARRAAWQAEQTAAAEGASWLAAASLDDVNRELARHEADGDYRRPGVTWDGLRSRRREFEAAAEELEADARHAAMAARVPRALVWKYERGHTLLAGLTVRAYYAKNPDDARVDVESQADYPFDGCLTLGQVCRALDYGWAVPYEGPDIPVPVLDRIGSRQWATIRRYDVDGRTVWVGRSLFGDRPMVLDAEGHLVRSRKAAATAAERWNRDETAAWNRQEGAK